MKVTLKRLLLFVAAVAFIAWLLHNASTALSHVESGENVHSVDWLPASASNVSFYKSYSFTSYEFDISESEFVKWSSWELSPLESPMSIARYCYFTLEVPTPALNASDKDWQAYEAVDATRSATITDGLYYEHMLGNGGGVWVAYDRNSGRAYFHSTPR